MCDEDLCNIPELGMFKSSFLHSKTVAGKKEFLKQLCFTLK